MKTKNFFFSLVLFSLLLPLAAAWEHNPLFDIPPHLSPGIYTIDVKLIYFDGQEATSRATFKVRENELLTSSVKEKYQSYAIYEAVFYILASLLILDIL